MSKVKSFSLLTDFDVNLFKSGKFFRAYEKLGSHSVEVEGEWGYYFAVWAPNATAVSVVGDFNKWQRNSHPLASRWDGSGIWEGFIPGLKQGLLYKYAIDAPDGRKLVKGDPFGWFWEVPPQTSTVTWDMHYEWQDHEWMDSRKGKSSLEIPYSVYEVHLGSWRKKPGATESLSYRELAEVLPAYLADMGFTHVEFLPVMEHPYFPSWGYQVTGYFAPTSRFGTPQDFMFLIDKLHQAGISVILDWVPSHFPTDAHGLADFDGTHLYDHSDPRQGFHPDWKSSIFNYGRNEVRSFLISNALYWLDYFHIDGLRVDAVASMLYLDYSREDGQWIPNQYGGNENLEAVDFLREFNSTVYESFPDTITIAEESTAWTGVSRPVYTGGLGFGQKWMMGWMHDTLNYFQNDPINRKYHHNSITFSLVYAFTENFMLPLSHDEVVHGKGPLIDKMPGDEWQRFANLRLLFGYMFAHPGTKLLFMGAEFGQNSEWSIEAGLDWTLPAKKFHKGLQTWVKKLNHLYQESTALYEQQFVPEGFDWINHGDHQRSVLSFLRKGKKEGDVLVIACNFTPVPHENFRIGVPAAGTYTEILNSNEEVYQGTGHLLNPQPIKADKQEWDGRDYSIGFHLPPLGIVVFKYQKAARKK
ncbi:MAG: 1,4-alpha-glucan branching enzyme [Bacteroidetes bacterium]|nr:MAG: 1,4-alpha-glucan branching enzyme [Bacteroidota bacterium]PTM09521.1 MAG: 1,4-alpha-glucan branching enzyme [Bacteroidota bacterium]